MRCTGTTKQGKRCRWPATEIAGGIAVCEYHVRQALRVFDEVECRNKDRYAVIFEAARRDSTVLP